jgi:hypothetical protein
MNYTGPTVSGGGLPGVTVPVLTFYVGGPGTDTPVDGQTQFRFSTFQGQSLVNKQLLVLREGIELVYADGPTPAAAHQISRYNDGTLGGFDFNTAVGPGQFSAGDRYDIFIVGVNNTIE